MVDTIDYRDSAKKLDLKLLEIAQRDLKPRKTVKRELLCEILQIPKDQDAKTTDTLIREVLIRKNKDLPHTVLKRRLLCNHFCIPFYPKRKKDTHWRFRILEILVKVSPEAISARDIAKPLNADPDYISKLLKGYYNYGNPWFDRITENVNGQTRYRWKATNEGIEAYRKGEAHLLKQGRYRKPLQPRKSSRKFSVIMFKILSVLAETFDAYTPHSIAIASNIDIAKVREALRCDHNSKPPYFKKILRNNGKYYRWAATNAGIETYYRWKRGI